MSKYGKEDYYVRCYCGSQSKDIDYLPKGEFTFSCSEKCTKEVGEAKNREWFLESRRQKIKEHQRALQAVQSALSKLYYIEEAPPHWWSFTPINAINDAEREFVKKERIKKNER